MLTGQSNTRYNLDGVVFFLFVFCQKRCANFIQKKKCAHWVLVTHIFLACFTAITVQFKIVAMDLTSLHLVGFPLCSRS